MPIPRFRTGTLLTAVAVVAICMGFAREFPRTTILFAVLAIKAQ